MIVLRSILFNILYVIWTLFLSVLCLPVIFMSRRINYACIVFWAKSILWLLRVICGIRSERHGVEHMTGLPVIYASKHQSAWDILFLVTQLSMPAFVLKRELYWIPLVGWYMQRMGMIAINRSRGVQAMKRMLRLSRDALHQRRSLVIFPEGTRRTIDTPPRYLPGVSALYSDLKVEVIPVALNSGQCWGRNSFIKRPGVIVAEFLPPIPAGLTRGEFLNRLETEIETGSKRLLKLNSIS